MFDKAWTNVEANIGEVLKFWSVGCQFRANLGVPKSIKFRFGTLSLFQASKRLKCWAQRREQRRERKAK